MDKTSWTYGIKTLAPSIDGIFMYSPGSKLKAYSPGQKQVLGSLSYYYDIMIIIMIIMICDM